MVSSAVLRQSQPEYGGYKMTKGTLVHLASSLATELGPRGIRMNTVAPSWIYEDVNKIYFDWMAEERDVTHEDIYHEIADKTDLKRLATPHEVAQATLFLASDLASAVSGITLDVSCGEFHGYSCARGRTSGRTTTSPRPPSARRGWPTSAAPRTRRGCGSSATTWSSTAG